MMTDAAICAAAVGAMAAYFASTSAKAEGLATALAAVLEIAAPATPLPPVALSASMVTKPTTNEVIKPNKIPEMPP